MSLPCVFLDRDGVINKETKNYIKTKEEFRLLKNAAKAIKLLNENKILAIVISNQSGIGKGFYSKETLEGINSLMKKRLAKKGAHLDAIYYCPHHPNDKCLCRKPEPGMFKKAAKDFALSLKDCWMIGDKIQDIRAGKNAGCKTILVLTGYGKEMLKDKENWPCQPDFIAHNLIEAVNSLIQTRG